MRRIVGKAINTLKAKVVVMESYTFISDQNEKECFKCKYMNILDVAAYTKWWKSCYFILNVHVEGYIQSYCVHYNLTHQHNTIALSGEEVALMCKITTKKCITVIGKKFQEVVQDHPSTYCIPECMCIVECYSYLYTSHTVCLLDLVAHT